MHRAKSPSHGVYTGRSRNTNGDCRGRICYNAAMTAKPTHKGRRAPVVPGTPMEDPPILDEQERAQLVASLIEAEAEIKAGKGAEYDPKALKDRLVGIYRGKKR